MIRLVLFLIAAGVLFAVVTGLSPWIAIVPLAILAVLAYTVGGMKLRCPRCGTRIKLGYNTCRNCGATYGAPR
jgi:zinc-ribbon domain